MLFRSSVGVFQNLQLAPYILNVFSQLVTLFLTVHLVAELGFQLAAKDLFLLMISLVASQQLFKICQRHVEARRLGLQNVQGRADLVNPCIHDLELISGLLLNSPRVLQDQFGFR